MYLKKIQITKGDHTLYPYSTDLFGAGGLEVDISQPITLLSGENGTGKSTLLKALAENIGFSRDGGSSDHYLSSSSDLFSGNIRLAWLPRVTQGFYFRSDKIGDYAKYFDEIAISGDARVYDGLGDRSLNRQSQGQAVFAMIDKYCSTQGAKKIVLLDEPESSLSVASQIKLTTLIATYAKRGVQFIIATHSPILLAVPRSEIFQVSKTGLQPIQLERTQPYLLMRQFVKEGRAFFEI
jgi:predicted ATPase